MTTSPIVLVPGFWLGAWAWDDVADALRADGHDVLALTLPGLESVDAERASITLADHADAIRQAVESFDRPVVLAVHSGAGVPGYMVTDQIPHLIAHAVYVDSGPATGALNPDFVGDELPLPSWEELAEDEANSVASFTEQQLATFRARSVPEPAGPMRQAPDLANAARLDVPTTVICTTMPAVAIQAIIPRGYAWIGGLAELRNVSYVDLPTSHWPMWTRPSDLAQLLNDIARKSERANGR
jgi:pimeloyl-ACP methyl ester carboxylesterase